MKGVSYDDFVLADKQGGDYEVLATRLLELFFKTELLNPDDYCCTASKGKEMLDQERLRGIRCKLFHVKTLFLTHHSATLVQVCHPNPLSILGLLHVP